MIKVYIYASDGLADWEAGYIMAELNTKRFFKENAPEISVYHWFPKNEREKRFIEIWLPIIQK